MRRQKCEVERREYERKQAEERTKKARNDSREELLQIVSAWAQAQRIEEFSADAVSRLDGMDPDRRTYVADRLGHAPRLVGTLDALERFRHWRAPSERLSVDRSGDDSEDD